MAIQVPTDLSQYKGILPYDAEQFGVYQPLLCWYGYQSGLRVTDAASRAAAAVLRSMANDFASAASDWTVQDPGSLVRLQLPSVLRSPVGNEIAQAASTIVAQTGKAPDTTAWQKLLSTDILQRYVDETTDSSAGSRDMSWPALQGSMTPSQAAIAGKSNALATADFFHWAILHAPTILNPLFLTSTSTWRTAMSFVNPFFGAPGIFKGRPLGAPQGRTPSAMLSPIGLINLYREYFFELDTFLGPPVGHIWVSPGGSLELYEINTRKTTVTQTTEMSTTETAKDEVDTTNQDEISDAVKTDNKNDTKLGASVNAGGSFFGLVHADAQASFNSDTSVQSSTEAAHKHSRNQSEKLSKEIARNFKTTFQTVTETTNTTSRRYVLANNGTSLANYELRRKLRIIGVQVQHIGTRLSWQAYVQNPASLLGVGEFVPAPADNSAAAAIQAPPPWTPPKPLSVPLTVQFAAMPDLNTDTGNKDGMDGSKYKQAEDPGTPGAKDPFSYTILHSYGSDLHVQSNYQYAATPPDAGYTLTQVSVGKTNPSVWAITRIDDAVAAKFTIHLLYATFDGNGQVTIDLSLDWTPPDPAHDPAKAAYDTEYALYQQRLAAAQLQDYINATRTLVKATSAIKPRPSADLRDEERDAIYRQLYAQLTQIGVGDQYVTAEYIRELFDVDQMLYYIEPDYYLPRALGPTPGFNWNNWFGPPLEPDPLAGSTVSNWPRRPLTDYYLITEDSQPAPKGSSLGWTIQLDSDERRNEFLNAAWVKAVIPIQPGRELDALAWLQNEHVEGVDGLNDPYVPQQGDPANYQGTVAHVLNLMATELAAQNTNIQLTLGTEKVFERGFDPLADGIQVDPTVDFKPGAYKMVDFWLEVLPTDQIVAVDYDPTKHGA